MSDDDDGGEPLDADEEALLNVILDEAVSVRDVQNAIRNLWRREPVANTPEWHAAVLRLVQALDAADTPLQDRISLRKKQQ